MYDGITTARRVPMSEARAWFDQGGAVLVSEHGHEETRPVTHLTVTHTRETIAWSELVRSVMVWRHRYPQQAYYAVGGAA